jgi:hypothetical protein
MRLWHHEKRILWWMMLCALLLGRRDFTDAFMVEQQQQWGWPRGHNKQTTIAVLTPTLPTTAPYRSFFSSQHLQRNSQSILWATSELDNAVVISSEETKITTVEQLEAALAQNPHAVSRETFHTIFRSILAKSNPWCSTTDVAKVNQLFRTMQQQSPPTAQGRPNRETYELVQQVWLLAASSSSSPEGAATAGSTRDHETWLQHLRSLWDVYHDAVSDVDGGADAKALLVEVAPRRSTYFNTFKGLLQCDIGSSSSSGSPSVSTRIIDDAEALFDEMLHQSAHPTVIHPDILCANQVLYV